MAMALASRPVSAMVATTTASSIGSSAANSQGASLEWASPEAESASSGQPKAITPMAEIRASAAMERGPSRTARAWRPPSGRPELGPGRPGPEPESAPALVRPGSETGSEPEPGPKSVPGSEPEPGLEAGPRPSGRGGGTVM
ncbi:hypothetical protein Srufu_055170 [Streptomyces libani subsp. rufus]|nr:hypothetical protein Srufu_055170 [Streptomyces libani subsp. rufus]